MKCSYDGHSADLKAFDEQICDRGVIISLDHVSHLPLHQTPILRTHVDDEVMYRFKNRTLYTFGAPDTVEFYVNTIPRLAVEYDYLRHTVYATTLMHDRVLSASSRPSAMEAYYVSQAAKVFNQKLSTLGFYSDEKVALWATAAYMCGISAALVGSTSSAEAWPLNETKYSNLDWLNMQKGLRTVWNLTRVDIHSTALAAIEKNTKFNCARPDVPDPGVEGVPLLLRTLYDLDANSTPKNHPYHAAVRYLTTLLPLKSTAANTLKFMIFAGGMTSDFQVLLQQKVPLALLLMGLWYTKLLKTNWFISTRACVECRSIYQYLEQQRIQNRCFKKVMGILQEACLNPDFDVADRLLQDVPVDQEEGQAHQLEGPTSFKVSIFWV